MKLRISKVIFKYLCNSSWDDDYTKTKKTYKYSLPQSCFKKDVFLSTYISNLIEGGQLLMHIWALAKWLRLVLQELSFIFYFKHFQGCKCPPRRYLAPQVECMIFECTWLFKVLTLFFLCIYIQIRKTSVRYSCKLYEFPCWGIGAHGEVISIIDPTTNIQNYILGDNNYKIVFIIR